MTSHLSYPVESLRSVDVGLPDLAAAEAFFVNTWHLSVVARAQGVVYLRGTGADHHLLALHASDTPVLRSVTFRSPSVQALDQIAHDASVHGGVVLSARAPLTEPGGGEAVTVRDPQGRVLRFVCGDTRHTDVADHKDRPVRLAHAVLNSHNVAEALPFYEGALGFKLSDRTRIMAFIRILHEGLFDHHSIALADADNDCLNHVAFLMPDVESVMRGGGRMKDAGYGIEWGPGRHGPGDNAFNYFVGPSDFVIEYTAEVEQVGNDYVAGSPDDWKWPPGRVDQWGISTPPSARLKQAQRAISFIATTPETTS
jgi:catechol-2,3-dioxygenase